MDEHNMSVMTAKIKRILVFDSGLGGLSIVKELELSQLNAELYYCADTAWFPYGEKSDAALIKRVPIVISNAANRIQADLVIVACNTASTLALDQVRASVKVPVIGVVPAIKTAVALTNTGVIGLLATPNTVRRPYTDKLILDFAIGINVLRYGATGLATTVERWLSGGKIDEAILQTSVDGLFDQDGGREIDAVVLACTHYPHVKDKLAALAPHAVIWVDSGAAIARRARELLNTHGVGAAKLVLAFTTGGNNPSTSRGLQNWGFPIVTEILL
jgi:glutamate racemase